MALFGAFIITLFISQIIRALFVVYPAMLLFGAVHSFLPVIPAFGFWQTFAIVILLGLIIPTSYTNKTDD